MGGSPEAPEPIDPFEQAQAQIQLMQEQARIDEENRLKQIQQQEAERQTKITDFNSALDSAVSGAFGRGEQLFGERGLNFADYSDAYQAELDRVRTTVPYLNETPGSYFSDSVFTNFIDRQTANRQREFTNQFDEFAGSGFAKNLFADTSDDAFINAILQEQYDPALGTLQNALNRGILNETGYNTALNSLNQQKTAATSRLQDLGSGVLSGYRDQLRAIGDEGRGAITNFDLGENFDPLSYKGRIDDLYGDLSGRLEGDIRNTLGGEQLFNVNDFIQRGGVSQGVQNTTGTLADVFAERSTKKTKREDPTRGLGSTGVF